MRKGTSYSYFILGIISFMTALPQCNTAPMTTKNPKSIIIEANISKYFFYQLKEIVTVRDVMSIYYTPFHYTSTNPQTESVSSRVKEGKVTWIINSDNPIKVIPPFGSIVIMNPGDSLHIEYQADNPVYTGSNTASYSLLDTLMYLDGRLSKPVKKNSYNARTIQDYEEWSRYLDTCFSIQLPIFDLYKDKVSPPEFDYYKSSFIGKKESERTASFGSLLDSVLRGYPGVTKFNIIQIWDSTQNKPTRQWFNGLDAYHGSMYDFYSYLRLNLRRQFGFDLTNDSLHSKEISTYLIYTIAKNKYKGLVRERLLAFILNEQVITEMGLKNPVTIALLKDYYSQPGYPEFKRQVQDLVKKRMEREKEKEKNREKTGADSTALS